jgi:hypothetical protein
MGRCATGKAPIHTALGAEMSTVRTGLITKARAAEDADDAAIGAGAILDAAEVDVENSIRELDGALAQLDRDNPELGAQLATFPEGFGAVIDPEGEDQLKALPALLVRVDPFKADEKVAPVLAKLAATAVAFKAALDAANLADEAYDKAFAEELAARTAVREQLESAYGKLRSFYKARPALAEAFFQKDSGARGPVKQEDLLPDAKAKKQPPAKADNPPPVKADNPPPAPPADPPADPPV